MATVPIKNINGDQVGSMDLDDKIFGIEPNEHAVHMAVVQYLANQRQGTKGTKTRAEVSGGGRKPWRQKGTGRARQGSTRSPQWTGGGVVFAPKPRDFSIKLNKKLKRLALKSVLSDKVLQNKITVIDNLEIPEIKTKTMVQICGRLNASDALVVTEVSDRNTSLSARNIPTVKASAVNTINVYDILNHDALLITKGAALKMQEVYI